MQIQNAQNDIKINPHTHACMNNTMEKRDAILIANEISIKMQSHISNDNDQEKKLFQCTNGNEGGVRNITFS